LRTFKTDIATTLRLMEQIDPGGAAIVSESGINTAADVVMLKDAGVNAVLVGEALMRERDMGAKVRELSGAGEC
jgi:indole-3-glycerol phosphate synthase